MREDTKLAVLGRENAKKNNAINTPPVLTSTLVFDSYKDFLHGDYYDSNFAEGIEPYELLYGREGSSITFELAKLISELEGADCSIITSTGASAVSTALTAFVQAGDHIIVTDSCYAVTKNVTSRFLKKFGVDYTFANPRCGKDVEDLIKPNTKVIVFESPASKTFDIQEIDEIVEVAKKHNILTIFDNTWGGPLLFKPLDHGIDVSFQSCSKYIDGGSDNFVGSISVKKKYFTQLYANSRYIVANASHFNVYMALRGIRTMKLRMEAHYKNGMKVAKFLESLPFVKEVFYPPLPSSPDHARWKKYFKGGTGLMSFVLDKEYSEESIGKMVDELKYFALGYSWGCYNSVITIGNLSQTANHSKYGKNTFMRIHVGLEDPDDLIEDLESGFERLRK